MTKKELAQQIKAKYPVYQNMDDLELADKIIQKYPVYWEQITEEKGWFISGVKTALTKRAVSFWEDIEKGAKWEINPAQAGIRFAGWVAGSVGDILFEWLKAITPEPIKEGVKKWLWAVASTDVAQSIANRYSEWAAKNPEQAKDLESSLNIASLMPIWKATQVSGRVLQSWVKWAKETVAAVKPALWQALATGWAIWEKAGVRIMSASLAPTIEQAAKKVAYKADTPLKERLSLAAKSIENAPRTVADVANKYNLVGLMRSEVWVRAKRLSNTLFENQVKPVLEWIKEKASKKEIFGAVRKKVDRVADISRRKALQKALNAVEQDYKNVASWSYKKLDEIKSSMAGRLPTKVWRWQEIAGDVNEIRKLLSNEMRTVVRSKLPKQIKDIYDDYGSLKEISTRGAKASTRSFDSGILWMTSEGIRAAAFPVTTIGWSIVSKTWSVIKKLWQKLLK